MEEESHSLDKLAVELYTCVAKLLTEKDKHTKTQEFIEVYDNVSPAQDTNHQGDAGYRLATPEFKSSKSISEWLFNKSTLECLEVENWDEEKAKIKYELITKGSLLIVYSIKEIN